MPSPPAEFLLLPGDPPSKREVLRCALHLFVRDGLCGTSIRDIAQESGYTNPALYKFFESKEALALHLFERCYLRMVREATVALAGGGTFRERLRRLVVGILALLDESPDAVLFVNEELRHYWRRLSPATRRHSLIGLTMRFFEDGEVTKAIEPTLLVAAFWGLFGQFARMHAFGEWKGPAVDAAPQLEALIFKMLGS